METLIYFNPEKDLSEEVLLTVSSSGHSAGIEGDDYKYKKIRKTVKKALKENFAYCRGVIDKTFAKERPKEVDFLIISSEGKPIGESIKAISMIRIVDKKILLDVICSIQKGLGKDHIDLLIDLSKELKYPIEIEADPKLVEKYYKSFGFEETGVINNVGLVEMIYTPKVNMNLEGGKRRKRTRKLRRKNNTTRRRS